IIRAHRYDASATLKDSLVIAELEGLFTAPDLDILRSDDRSKILLYFIDRQKELRAFMFDNEKMELMWEYSFEPQDMRYSEDVLHLSISNDGDMFFVIEKDNYRVRKKDHHYEIFHYGPGFKSVVRKLIDLEELKTFDLFFNYDNANKQLVAGGFYYDKNPARAEGFFFTKVPDGPNGNSEVFLHPFSDKIVESLLGKELRKNRGLEEVGIQDVVMRRDGGVVIIGEENRNFFRRTANTGRSIYDGFVRSVTDFYYNDVFALSIGPNGELDWETILHKKQFSQDDGGAYSSFFLFKNPRNLRLIFNDEIKLENTVSEYVLAGTGNFNRNSILSTDNQNLRLRFRDAVQVSADMMLVPSENRGRLRIAKLEL
ncbi:MAG: hypothetical protein AAF242_20045, partial [Bacteroidota bacterium]